MGLNLLKEVEELVVVFRKHNRLEISAELQDALDSSSTGTELIMRVKHYLKSLDEGLIPKEIELKVKRIIAEIDSFLV